MFKWISNPFFVLHFSEEEARMVELAIMGGFADTKFLSRTLSSQIERLRTRSDIYSNSFLFYIVTSTQYFLLCFFTSMECSMYEKPLRPGYPRISYRSLITTLFVCIVSSCQEAFAKPVKEISPNLQARCMPAIMPPLLFNTTYFDHISFTNLLRGSLS